jgi:hypothetical protein
MKEETIINLKDIADETYLMGVFGEGWTYDVSEAYKFENRFYAWLAKLWARISNNQKLVITTRIVFS